jgi:hypothetical protein
MCGHETDGAGVPLAYCAPEEIAEHCPAGGVTCPGHPVDDEAHPKHCACEACDPLYQMTREGDTP